MHERRRPGRAIGSATKGGRRERGSKHLMITVVIPTLNAEAGLPATLTALVPAAVDGLVREVIVVDGGSTDFTCRIAEEMGAEPRCSPNGRRSPIRETRRTLCSL